MKKFNINYIFLTLALISSFSVLADETDESDEPVNCNARFSNTLELAACFDEQLKEYDEELNETYQSIIVELKSRGTWGSLKKAQKEWIVYRDKNCMFHSDLFFRGSAAGPVYVQCQARMTKERLDELSQVLEYLEQH